MATRWHKLVLTGATGVQPAASDPLDPRRPPAAADRYRARGRACLPRVRGARESPGRPARRRRQGRHGGDRAERRAPDRHHPVLAARGHRLEELQHRGARAGQFQPALAVCGDAQPRHRAGRLADPRTAHRERQRLPHQPGRDHHRRRGEDRCRRASRRDREHLERKLHGRPLHVRPGREPQRRHRESRRDHRGGGRARRARRAGRRELRRNPRRARTRRARVGQRFHARSLRRQADQLRRRRQGCGAAHRHGRPSADRICEPDWQDRGRRRQHPHHGRGGEVGARQRDQHERHRSRDELRRAPRRNHPARRRRRRGPRRGRAGCIRARERCDGREREGARRRRRAWQREVASTSRATPGAGRRSSGVACKAAACHGRRVRR